MTEQKTNQEEQTPQPEAGKQPSKNEKRDAVFRDLLTVLITVVVCSLIVVFGQEAADKRRRAKYEEAVRWWEIEDAKRKAKENSAYTTPPTTNTNTKPWKGKGAGSGPMDSYDKGYEDVHMDSDYDADRYRKDRDYADGVDDALDDAGDNW